MGKFVDGCWLGECPCDTNLDGSLEGETRRADPGTSPYRSGEFGRAVDHHEDFPGDDNTDDSNAQRAEEKFAVKDSGERHEFKSGMVRDVSEGKTDYLLLRDGPMLKRWAIHLTKGARKYSKSNWLKAEGESELSRFRESAARHFEQWLAGEVDEDHAAAVYFNINGAEYVRSKMEAS